MNDFYDATARRLREYYSFSEATISAVASFAQKQSQYSTYQDFFASVGMPKMVIHRLSRKQGATVIDIAPRKTATTQPAKTIVVHLPMSNPLDTNQQYQLATLAGMFPDARIIGFGNPSNGPYAHVEHSLSVFQKLGIAIGIDVRPLVAAELDYLQTHGVEHAYHIGYSYGALKTLLSTSYAKQGSVDSIVTIELVSHPRNPIRLANDFKDTLAPLGSYVDATNLETFKQARDAATHSRSYHKSLFRPINMAIGSLISRVDALRLAKRVAILHPKAHMTLAWGTKSELVDDARMEAAIAQMQTEFPNRVSSIQIRDHKHGLANDVHLHAAIIYEALAKKQFLITLARFS